MPSWKILSWMARDLLHHLNFGSVNTILSFKKIDANKLNSSSYSATDRPFSKDNLTSNDGIQKFTINLNGFRVRTWREHFEITQINWVLTKIPEGSVNESTLCNQVMFIISIIKIFVAIFKIQNLHLLKIIRF